MHGLISSPATKHRAMWAPGRARIQEEQRWRVKVEGSRGNPSNTLWLYAGGGLGLFVRLLSFIWVCEDPIEPKRKLKLREILRGGELITDQAKVVSEAG